MKKAQRSFVVEYKSGWRKADPMSNSIWGNMDLKSVTQAVQDDFMPLPSVGSRDSQSDSAVPHPDPEQTHPLLTVPSEQTKTSLVSQETNMADDTDTMIHSDAPAVADASVVTKKQRKPRATKAAAEAAATVVAVEPTSAPSITADKPKRGRKFKSIEVASSAKRIPVKRTPKAVSPATAAPTSVAAAPAPASDEMADLLQLEEENQRLRKQLAEKLRVENADLKKRLNLA